MAQSVSGDSLATAVLGRVNLLDKGYAAAFGNAHGRGTGKSQMNITRSDNILDIFEQLCKLFFNLCVMSFIGFENNLICVVKNNALERCGTERPRQWIS